MVLQAAHGLVDEQIVEQRPGLLDDDLADSPIVVALFEGFAQHHFGDVERAPRASDVEGLVLARVVKNQQRRALHQRDADVVVE